MTMSCYIYNDNKIKPLVATVDMVSMTTCSSLSQMWRILTQPVIDVAVNKIDI